MEKGLGESLLFPVNDKMSKGFAASVIVGVVGDSSVCYSLENKSCRRAREIREILCLYRYRWRLNSAVLSRLKGNRNVGAAISVALSSFVSFSLQLPLKQEDLL